MGSKGLPIRADVPAAALRRLAARDAGRAMARRMMAIAHALEGMPRAEAARLAGMERQALRDAVVRYNAEGLAGLCDRPRRGCGGRGWIRGGGRCCENWLLPVRMWSGLG